jgi:predicted methyltransferase
VWSGKSLHRIDENIVKREVEAAGFKLVAEGDFLRHPEDKRESDCALRLLRLPYGDGV